MSITKQSGMRLDDETQAMLKILMKKLGASKTGVVRQAVRKLCEQEGIKIEEEK